MQYDQQINTVSGGSVTDLAVGEAPAPLEPLAEHFGTNLVQCQGGRVRVTFDGVEAGSLVLDDGDTLLLGPDGFPSANFSAAGPDAARVSVLH